MIGCGAAEETGLGFVCFVVNPRVLSAYRVDFLFHKIFNFTPPPPQERQEAIDTERLASLQKYRKSLERSVATPSTSLSATQVGGRGVGVGLFLLQNNY